MKAACSGRSYAHAVALAASILAACGSPIVGAECAEGFVACDNECVDLASNRLNCGACGNICPVTDVCIDGMCGVPVDGGVPDGSTDGDIGDMSFDIPRFDGNNDFDGGDGSMDGGDGSTDGSTDGGDGSTDGSVDGGDGSADSGDGSMDGGGTDGSTDGSMMGCACDLGELCCDDVCVLPDRDRRNCGGCGIVCGAAEFCADSSCEPVCEAPLELCGDVCIDTSSDRDNCGGCGIRCASGICQDSMCVSSSEGHVVLIGHDYRVDRTGQNFLMGNSVFIPFGDAVDVLVYEGDAIGSAINGVDRAVNQVSTLVGRDWNRIEAPSAEDVPRLLADADVFLLYAQSGASDSQLRSDGAAWSTAFMSFLRRGGVVIVSDGGGVNSGTWQVLDAAGLFNVGGRTDVDTAAADPADNLRVVDGGDAVARGVPSTYRGEEKTVYFMSAPDDSVVVMHAMGPVAIHQVLRP